MQKQNQLQEIQPTKEIQAFGKSQNLPLKNLESLPTILRNEIEYPLFRNSGKQIDVLNKISAMLGFKPEDEDRKTIAIEWVNFVSQYKLTAPEVIEAYNKALKRELRNEKNEVIRLFPNLSLISAGEILSSFVEFKKHSKDYERGENELKKFLNPEARETEEERKIRVQKTWELILEMVSEGRESEVNFGFIIYKDFRNAGKLKDVVPTKQELHDLEQDKMRKLITKELVNRTFYSKKELDEMKKKEILPVHNIVRQNIRDEIIVRLAKKELEKVK